MTLFNKIVNNIKYRILEKQSEKPFFVYETKLENDLVSSYKLRFMIFCQECKYLNENYFPNGQEKDIYDEYSLHFIAREKKTKKIIGTVRLVKNNSHGLPIEKDFGLNNIIGKIKTENPLEVSRLVVDKKHRKISTYNHGALLSLIKIIYQYCEKNNHFIIVAAIDNKLYHMLKKFGFSFQVLGPSKYYMGSNSIPVAIDIRNEIMWLKIVNPPLWKYLSN